MGDQTRREREREALSADPAELSSWAAELWRTNHKAAVCTRLLDAFRLGTHEAGTLALEFLSALPLSERKNHIRSLVSFVAAGHLPAGPLLAQTSRSFARVWNVDPTPLASLSVSACQAAIRDDPVRLAGRSTPDQALVANFIHDVSGGTGLHASRNQVAPSVEFESVRYFLDRYPFATVFIFDLTNSHYSRLEERLSALCRERSARLIYGIRLDAWDGEEFVPFDGLEVNVPALQASEVMLSDLVQENVRELPAPSSLEAQRLADSRLGFLDASRLARSYLAGGGDWRTAIDETLGRLP